MLNGEKRTEDLVTQAVEQFTTTLKNTLESVLRAANEGARKEPEPPARTAKGTGDHAETAREAVRRANATPVAAVTPKPLPQLRNLRDRIEQALRAQSLDAQQISREVDASAGRVSEVMKALKVEGKVVNVGTEVHPIWTYRIGNETSTAELTETVRRLLTERPFTIRELSEVTGASYSRCGGAVIALQRDPKVNIMSRRVRGNAFYWFVQHPDMRDAHIEPKKPKRT